MSILIYNKEDQASGNFNSGEILEKKPIGFLQDGGELNPYSNLFYWADAWTPSSRSTIGLHPHQGFEICSFVIEGSIKHFDSQQNKWIELLKGDAQIIRSGNGISHAEEILDNSRMFQIWFDPDISKTLLNVATYDDYKLDDFKIIESNNCIKKIIKGDSSPIELISENILINEFSYSSGNFEHKLSLDLVSSIFVLEGEGQFNNQLVKKGDFIIIQDEETLNIMCSSYVKLFEITSLKNSTYPTYFQRFA